MTDLTKILLGEGLTQTERLYLGSLAHHDGFPVLKKLFDQACKLATEDVLKVDPEDKEYASKVQARAMRARIINEFVGSIRKSFEANVMIANEAEEKENAGTKSAAN